MRLVIQRVHSAQVTRVDTQQVTGSIAKGLVVLWGIQTSDTWEDAEYCLRKVLNIKLWDDKEEKSWGSSVMDNNYEVLMVSQFTLFGSVKKGNKPDFHLAMKNESSCDFFARCVAEAKRLYEDNKIQVGSFGNYMKVDIHGDGPVTIVIDSQDVQLKRKQPGFSTPAESAPP